MSCWYLCISYTGLAMSNINKLDIKQMRVLQLLLQERNASKVANIMGLTQQAISEQLRKLRQTFDDEMFLRANNQFIPTPFAESLVLQINTILSQIDKLFVSESFSPVMLTGTLHISCTDYALITVLPSLLKRVCTEAPNLKVIIREFESDNLNQILSSGEVDLAITFPKFIPESYPSMLLFEEQHICVKGCKSDYLPREYTLKEVASFPQVVVSPSRPNLKGSHDAWFIRQGFKRNVVMSVPNFSTVPDIIEETNLIAFLPSRLLPHKKVMPINIKEKTPKFKIIATWHHRSDNSPLHQWLLSLLTEIFRVE